MDTKHIHHIHPHFPFPCAYPLPTGTQPQKRFSFPPALHVFKLSVY
jgi:hypothetical protein